ncbi:hypothetical protein KCP78_10720 [Salmonella enterica subsp. enterica]|nr:hypothetical protein KCP78_10720 [Salmonella enterica subsp. enterica]
MAAKFPSTPAVFRLFYKHFQTAVKSCSQGGVRGGARHCLHPMHRSGKPAGAENNRGVEGNRVRLLRITAYRSTTDVYPPAEGRRHYCQVSPSRCTRPYDAFFADQTNSNACNAKYENDTSANSV